MRARSGIRPAWRRWTRRRRRRQPRWWRRLQRRQPRRWWLQWRQPSKLRRRLWRQRQSWVGLWAIRARWRLPFSRLWRLWTPGFDGPRRSAPVGHSLWSPEFGAIRFSVARFQRFCGPMAFVRPSGIWRKQSSRTIIVRPGSCRNGEQLACRQFGRCIRSEIPRGVCARRATFRS